MVLEPLIRTRCKFRLRLSFAPCSANSFQSSYSYQVVRIVSESRIRTMWCESYLSLLFAPSGACEWHMWLKEALVRSAPPGAGKSFTEWREFALAFDFSIFLFVVSGINLPRRNRHRERRNNALRNATSTKTPTIQN